MPADLQARGGRVRVHTVVEDDVAPYRLAVQQSRARIGRWNPVNPDDLLGHLAAQSRSHRTFLVRALEPEGDHDVVGKVNVTNVVRGRFLSAAMGYDSYDPYAGRGLFAEGIRLVVGLAFAPEPTGMGLHRVEANVQPGNVTSAGLLRAMGFRHEGFTPRMMWMADAAGEEEWRDHDRYAVTAEEWPAPAFRPQRPHRLTCRVVGDLGHVMDDFVRRLATELALPLFSQRVVGDPAVLGGLLADSPVGGVLAVTEGTADRGLLARSGVDVGDLVEIRCETTGSATASEPGSSAVVRVDTSSPVPDREVSRVALEVRRITASRPQRSR